MLQDKKGAANVVKEAEYPFQAGSQTCECIGVVNVKSTRVYLEGCGEGYEFFTLGFRNAETKQPMAVQRP